MYTGTLEPRPLINILYIQWGKKTVIFTSAFEMLTSFPHYAEESSRSSIFTDAWVGFSE